ncbi:MAG: SMC-Scp complex subunit ScpB [bacterium]|nr:SMC-Scp complex subunit ScpB [bacterium]
MTQDKQLLVQIEALLFVLGRPLSRSELAGMLEVGVAQIEGALLARVPGGIALVDDGVELELRTAPEAATVIEKVRTEEYARDIGRAGLEALATIVYRGPLSRSEIDFIRGVNSSQTLRTLLMRGLVRKSTNSKSRATLYEPTTELLAELGATHQSDLSDYAEVRKKLTTLETAYRLSAQAGSAQNETSVDTL